MKTKVWAVSGAIACAGIAAGATLAWWAQPPRPAAGVRTALSISGDDVTTAPRTAEPPTRATESQPVQLRLDGPAPPHKIRPKPRSVQSKSAPAAQKPQPIAAQTAQEPARKNLDLRLPEPDTPEDTSDDATATAPRRQPTSAPPTMAISFDAKPTATPKVRPDNLFKAEYGLRGFMTQSWITQRFAIQGGLGLNNDRLIPTDSGLRDDIAVGMGVVLAF